MDELKYCKDCINAKKVPDREPPLWHCGKHRLYITPKTCYQFYKNRECADYMEKNKA